MHCRRVAGDPAIGRQKGTLNKTCRNRKSDRVWPFSLSLTLDWKLCGVKCLNTSCPLRTRVLGLQDFRLFVSSFMSDPGLSVHPSCTCSRTAPRECLTAMHYSDCSRIAGAVLEYRVRKLEAVGRKMEKRAKGSRLGQPGPSVAFYGVARYSTRRRLLVSAARTCFAFWSRTYKDARLAVGPGRVGL